jgi:hypothetical protein
LPFYYAAPRRNVPQRRRCQCSATSADWRQRCDADGVVSYYDFGIRLGDQEHAAAAPKPSATSSFAKALDEALKGDSTHLREELASDVIWQHGLGEAKGAKAALKLVEEAADFYDDPRLDVLASTENEFRWLASGTQPVQWSPRVLVHGTTTITRKDGKVTRVVDTWDSSPTDIGLQQVAPKFWDVFDLWATPVAETPCEEVLDKFKFSMGEARLVRTPERLCLVCSLDDVSNSRKQRVASALPDFVFLADTRSPTDVIAATTTPLSVSIEALPLVKDEPRKRRVTWALPLPTALGLDFASLPELPRLKDLTDGSLELGVAENPSLTYALQPAKLYVCASYSGDPQDAAAAPLRKALAEVAVTQGLSLVPGPNGGAAPAVLRKWRAKLGYSDTGALAYAMESNAPSWVAVDGNELCVEVRQ